ncbi:MAG TPA: ATP-binding protein [Vicinamibacteria bacterium]|nr:ATP-binding protein [Vicinamibacteria bacterium]
MDRGRYLEAAIATDLPEKMVFVAGPRQVGKTTLARRVLRGHPGGAYLSWDNRDDWRDIRAARWPGGKALVVLDELHKWRGWKGWLKGEFDKHRARLRFLVTGSARLDVYRKGGDSLQGRYHHYRLHPFSYAEAASQRPPQAPEPGKELAIPDRGQNDLVAALLAFGGFPEPFLAQSGRALRRWQKERLDRFFREDVRDLEAIRDLSSFQLLADMLPERVGSPLSLNALREDLEVSHRALTHWMEILERLYHVFRVRPFAGPRARVLKKMPKAYLWDASLVPEPAARFENLVGLHLLKLCHFLEDAEGYAVSLHYLRDREGREVDFLVALDRKPWLAVEVKLSETRVDPALLHFRERLAIPFAYQVTLEGTRDFVERGVRVLPASRFLAALV